MRAESHCWVALSAGLLLAGCRCRPPPTIVCDRPKYFVAPDLQLAQGHIPAPPKRLGQRIPGGAIAEAPSMLELKDPTHMEVDWAKIDLYVPEFVIYSREEQVGRSESEPG